MWLRGVTAWQREGFWKAVRAACCVWLRSPSFAFLNTRHFSWLHGACNQHTMRASVPHHRDQSPSGIRWSIWFSSLYSSKLNKLIFRTYRDALRTLSISSRWFCCHRVDFGSFCWYKWRSWSKGRCHRTIFFCKALLAVTSMLCPLGACGLADVLSLWVPTCPPRLKCCV